jgi:hypothetical protein
MVLIKYYLSLLVIILWLAVFPLKGVKIFVFDCNKKILNPKMHDYAEKWHKAADNVINNQNVIDCLPRNWRKGAETWMKYRRVKIMICKNKLDPSDCGSLGDEHIIVPAENKSGCGCEEATIFHEFIHQAGPAPEDEKTDRKIRGCEKLILIRFIKNCQGNPPAGDPCDCMDNEDNPSPCRDSFQTLLIIKNAKEKKDIPKRHSGKL